MPMDLKALWLGDVPIAHECERVYRYMYDRYGPEKVENRIPRDDWARWSIALGMVEASPSILDVGTAHGIFMNSLAATGRHERICGIDVRDYTLYSEMLPQVSRTIADAEEIPFGDGEFHTVTCMEVIEHLEDGKMERVIAQLRRVAARRLIVSVPFCEGFPLYKGHTQRFTPPRIGALFPKATYTLLVKEKKGGTPWLVIDEPR